MTDSTTIDIKGNTLLLRNQCIISSKINNETVMIDVDFENYYGLEEIGTRIWELLATQISFDGLCNKLISEFNVSREQCESDIIPFLLELIEQRMIDIK